MVGLVVFSLLTCYLRGYVVIMDLCISVWISC